MDWPLIIGSTGAGIILIAFVLNQIHRWQDTYLIYDLCNAVGSLMLVHYAWVGHSWPFLVLNGVWAAVSLRDCVIDLQRNSQRTGGFWEKWMR